VILTVTLNAALDVTYDVDAVVPRSTHRVRECRHRAGGKGVNVASVLSRMRVPVTASGFLGGRTGAEISADLDARALAHAFFRCTGESRRTVNVVSAADGDATIFNEPGPDVTQAEWSALVDGIPGLLIRSRAVVMVLAGSLPRGVPEDAYARLVVLARDQGVRTVVDADGAVLRQAVAAHPDVVKPNLAELAAATGRGDALAAARELQRRGALDVVVSCGPDGAVVLPRGGGRLTARLRPPLSGNPTGAGDAMVAALAAGLAGGARTQAGGVGPVVPGAGRRGEQGAAGPDWSTAIRQAVAWSAAAVLQPLAGDVDPDDVTRIAADVELEQR